MVVQYGIAAAEAAGESIGAKLLGLSQVVSDSIQSVRVNRDEALALARRIEQLIAVVSEGLDVKMRDSEIDTLDASRQAMHAFQHALEEVRDCLAACGGQSYLLQILNQRRNRERLDVLSGTVDRAFDSLMIQLKIEASSLIARTGQREDALGAVLSTVTQVSVESNEIGRQPELVIPPRPQLFFGREAEIGAVAETVACAEPPGRVAILGGPGMGKTTLAVAVLHHPTVIARFNSRRFFVPFDAAESQSSSANCFSTVACALGIVEPDATRRQKLLAEFLECGRPSLLVLDNFESAWESADSRAEELLAFFSEIGGPGLALVVNMRGAERPHGIAWTRPFLPPLAPLSDDAARQVFYAIAAAYPDDADVDELLRHMGNVPLAVVLMASLAQFEPPAALVVRWAETKTAMLVRTGGGTGALDRLSSLDVSIEVSVRAPRLAQSTGALELLGVLALLPAGIVDSDLQPSAPANARALPCVLQSELAHRSSDGRVRMLAPVRAFVLARYPPSEQTAGALYAHYFGMATLLADAAREGTLAAVYAPAAAEVDNIEALIAHALQQSSDPTPALEAVVALCSNLTLTGLGSASALLPAALAVSRRLGRGSTTGDLLYQWAELAYASLRPGEPEALYREAKRVYERCADDKGIRSTSIKLLIYLPAPDALEEAERIKQQATEAGDIASAALCCTEIANLRARGGDIAGAVAAYEEAVQELTRAGLTAHHLLGYSLCSIADHLGDMGDVQGAKAALQRAVPICAAAGSRTTAADASVLLAVILHQQGAAGEALGLYEQAFQQYRLSNGYYAVKTLAYMAQAHLAAGDEHAAARVLDAAQQMVHAERDKNLPAQRAMVLQARAELALWRGDLAEAHALGLAAEAVAREPDPVIEPEYMLSNQTDIVETMGKIHAAQGDRDKARMSFILAAAVWRRFGWSTAVVRVLVLLADTVDDDAAEKILDAVMLPLLRFCWRPRLGAALLLSARIAQRRGQVHLARHRAESALAHFVASGDQRGHDAVNVFLDELQPVTSEL